MKIKEIEKLKFLNKSIFDMDPNRFIETDIPVSDRILPFIYECEKCNFSISFSENSFEKHNVSNFSNLNKDDFLLFLEFKKDIKKDYSFLDFYCPNCQQPTFFLFIYDHSGYWSGPRIEILHILVLKS